MFIMTEAQNVPPAVTGGDVTAATARLAALAAHASVASADWSAIPRVVDLVDTRG